MVHSCSLDVGNMIREFLHYNSDDLAQYFAAPSELTYTTCVYGSVLLLRPG